MRNNHSKFLIKIFTALSLFLLMVAGYNSYGQQKGQMKVTEITGTVEGNEGNAVPGARVLYQNGTKSVTTDSDGTFTLKTLSNDVLVIKTQEYETKYVSLQKADLSEPIALVRPPLYMAEDAVVSLPYHKMPDRMVTGA
ncbi:MAG: carboxypeptidase-like regulatory domain-containing protein, partial [Bacteroidales bacterium]|nr:carboxypeptidase-like regulatory domain-containing protein [Bacteroidales bacterium]